MHHRRETEGRQIVCFEAQMASGRNTHLKSPVLRHNFLNGFILSSVNRYQISELWEGLAVYIEWKVCREIMRYHLSQVLLRLKSTGQF